MALKNIFFCHQDIPAQILLYRLFGRTKSAPVNTLALGEFKDMVKVGIIDPAKVVHTALQDMASVAGLLIIAKEVMVIEKTWKKPAGVPDMGVLCGMDDMAF
jgi:chaperonin GroEL (HSP60 family)